MRILSQMYEKVLQWSRHPKAARYLGILSFIDSSIFPVSPMFMFIPMSFAAPHRTFWFATLATIGSILGGIIGYALGYFAFDVLMQPFFEWMGYLSIYDSAVQWFQRFGFWAVLFGCFSPIPYKVFTIGAGALQLHFGLFILASALGRFLRFFVIGALIWWWGPKVEPFLNRMLRFKNP